MADRPADGKPCFAFVIPWPIDTAGGVNHVIHHLARECKVDGKYDAVPGVVLGIHQTG